jgi:predicted Zn-dependent protease
MSLIDHYSPVLRYFSPSAHALVTLAAEDVTLIQSDFLAQSWAASIKPETTSKRRLISGLCAATPRGSRKSEIN